MRRPSRASTSARRHYRTAAGASSRLWGCGPRSPPMRRPSPGCTSRTRATSGSRASMRRSRGSTSLGHVVPNRSLGSALWSALAQTPRRARVLPGSSGARSKCSEPSIELNVAETRPGVQALRQRPGFDLHRRPSRRRRRRHRVGGAPGVRRGGRRARLPSDCGDHDGAAEQIPRARGL